MSNQQKKIRNIHTRPVGEQFLEGYLITVGVRTLERKGPRGEFRETDSTGGGRFAFAVLGEWMADNIRGEIPEDAVILIGENFGKHYYQSKDHSSVPYDVLEKLQEKGYQLYTNIDGGWDNWGGRPEFDDSVSYLDVTDAEPVDMQAIIDERTDDS